MSDKLLTVQEAADLLGLSTKTLRRWDQARILIPLRTDGGQRRYQREKIEAFKISGKPSAKKTSAYRLPRTLRITKPVRLRKPRAAEIKLRKSEILDNLDNLLTVQNAAYILGVSTKTLRRWDEAGILVSLRTIGGQRRYLRKQVETLREVSPNYIPKVPGLEMPIKVNRTYDKRISLSKTQTSILFSTVCIFVILGFITVIKKTNFVIPDPISNMGQVLIGNLDSRFRGNDRGVGNDKGVLKQAIKVNPRGVGQKFALYSDKGVVLGEATSNNGLFFNVNVPSIFNNSSEFVKGLHAAEIATLSGGLITENQDINAGTGELTASNVLYGATAGSGISIGTGQTPTITNTGVLSIGGKTGAVTLSAGSGISISDLTITNSDKGSSQNIFKKITVGSSTIEPGSNSDTLTLTAGTGITLTPNTTSKTITVAGTSESGWTDDGTTVRLTTSTDSVGIGTTSPSTTLHVVGTSTFTSTSSFNGGVTLGDATSDTLTLYSRITVGNDTTGNALEPTTGSKFDLGSSTRTWRTLYVDTLSAGDTSINGTNADDFRINADNATADTESSTLTFERGTPAVNAALKWNATGTPSKLFSLNAPLFINPDAGISYSGTSALIVDQPQAQDIFTASASGTTRFRISNAGHVLPGADNAYDIGSSTLQWRNLYVAGQIFGGATGTQGHWQRASGSLAPANITDDLLLGATSTSSARFAVLNIAGGTPTASVSANSGNNAAFLTGLGNLATTNMQTLTVGGSTTGNITIDSGSSSITLSDDTTISGDLAVNGATSADITSTTTTGTLFNTTVTTLSVGGAATTFNLGTTDSVTRTINLGTGTGADTINIGTGATTANTINVGTGAVANTIAIGSSSSTTVSITDDNWSITAAGLITTADDLAVNGGDITTTASAFNLLNATATTVNFAGAATTLNIADSTTTKTIDIGGVTSSGTDTINISTEGTASDTIAIGNTNASTTLVLTGGDDWTMAATGVLTMSASAAQTTAIVVTDTDYTNAISLGDNVILGTTAAIDFSEFDVSASTGSITINDGGDLGNISIEATILDINSLDFTAAGTITAGGTGNIVLGLDSDTVLDTGTGSNIILATDLNFLDAEGGNLLMEITDSGTTGTLNVTGRYDINGTAGVTVGSASCVTSTGGIVIGSAACPAGETTVWWDQNNGALNPKNSTVDLLIGGTSTASAKFAVLNVNSGTPTASVSAGAAGAAYLSATGTLATTALQTLTLGSSTTTGNVILNPSGNIGIGTASPASGNKLHVEGQCVIGDTRLRRGRRKSKVKSQNSKPEDEYIWEEVLIKDIQPGDEILSLDEVTGEFVPQVVEKLMDMGRQEVFALVTTSGKKIETTANHPYLVKQEKRIIEDLLGVFGTSRPFAEGNVHEQENDQKQRACNHKICINIQKIIHSLSRSSSVLTDATKKTIPEIISNVNGIRALGNVILAKFGVRNASPKYPAEKLTNNPENALSQGLEENIFMHATLADYIVGVNQANEKVADKKAESWPTRFSKETWLQGFIAPGQTRKIRESTPPSLLPDSSREWKKVKYLKPGMTIATIHGWEKISNIYPTGRKQTYDIQVANTHNFVGNDIVAHNTYINGNLGIGDTSPDVLLDILSATTGSDIIITNTNATDTDVRLGLALVDGTNNFTLGVDDSDNDTFKIGTTALETSTMLTLDSRTGTSGVSTITLAGIAPSFASAATAEYTTLTVTPPTITLTGGTQVTSQMDSILISQPTITDTTAITVDDAATMTIAGAAISGSAGSVTISDSYALKINTTSVDAGTGTVTRAYGLYVDAPTGAGTNYAAAFVTGNVGIGDATPDALLDIDSTDTDGGDFLITNTGVGTSGSVGQITSNSTTTGDIFTISATGLTTGDAFKITGPSSTGITSGTSAGLVSIASDVGSAGTSGVLMYLAPDFSAGSATTGYGVYNAATDATAIANTDYGYYGSLTLTGNAAKTGIGIYQTTTSSSTTADTLVSLDTATDVTGIMTTGTRNVYGARIQPSAGAESTGGTTNVYGVYSRVTADVAAGGTVNGYGLYVANGTFDTDGTSTQYGLYVESPTGADTNYAAIFAGGNVGIGSTAPTDLLTLRSDSAGATTALLRLENLATATVSTGGGINFYANRTTGGSTNIIAMNGVITSIDNTNYQSRFDLRTAQAGALTTQVAVGGPNIQFNLPLDVNVGGDVGFNYDIMFLNTGMSYITSEGPLSILAGDANHAENLVLGTQGTGDVVADINDSASTGGFKVLGSSGYVFNVQPGGSVGIGTTSPISELHVTRPLSFGATGKALAIFNQIESQEILSASSSGTTIFTLTGGSGGDVLVGAAGANVTTNIGGNGVLAYGAICADDSLDTADDCIDASRTAGTVYGIASSFTIDDIAENFPTLDSSIEAGDVVGLNHQPKPDTPPSDPFEYDYETEFVEKSTVDSAMLGVISEKPGVLLGGHGQKTDPRSVKEVPVVLAGRVPVKVSIENGRIIHGDFLTPSSIKGVAMKATKPGRVIGMALENFDQDGIGKILVFVNPSWHDPDVYLTSTGDIEIRSKDGKYSLVNNSTNADILRVGAFSEIAAGNIRAGYIDAQALNIAGSINTDSLSIAGQSLKDYVASSSAQTYNLATDPLFKDSQDKVAALESKLGLLSQTVQEQASISAFLEEIVNGQVLGVSTSSAALVKDLGNVDLNNATISGTLMVLGRTTVTDLGITGDISAGLISIHGLDSSINTLSGPLYLQNEGLGGIDILNSKITIDTKGNIEVAGTITASKINIDTKDKEAASIGTGVITASQTSVAISSPWATEKSKIFVTAITPTGKQSLFVKEKNAGTGFVVAIEQPYNKDITFDWWVVN